MVEVDASAAAGTGAMEKPHRQCNAPEAAVSQSPTALLAAAAPALCDLDASTNTGPTAAPGAVAAAFAENPTRNPSVAAAPPSSPSSWPDNTSAAAVAVAVAQCGLGQADLAAAAVVALPVLLVLLVLLLLLLLRRRTAPVEAPEAAGTEFPILAHASVATPVAPTRGDLFQPAGSGASSPLGVESYPVSCCT